MNRVVKIGMNETIVHWTIVYDVAYRCGMITKGIWIIEPTMQNHWTGYGYTHIQLGAPLLQTSTD